MTVESNSRCSGIMAMIPAYREGRFIRDVAERAKKEVDAVIVIDDGSPDNTRTEAEASGVEVIVHPRNQGKGAAIKTGLKRFLETDYSHVIMLDGDGQHLPEEISRFRTAIESSDAGLVIGNRMTDTTRMPLVRRLVNRYMSWRISAICGQEIPDTQCGFRMLDREVVPLVLSQSNAFEYETEMLFDAALNGQRIVSVPVSTIYGEEVSKIRPVRDAINFFNLLRRQKRKKRNR